MLPDLRHLPVGFTPKQFVAAGVGTLAKDWDLVILIDANDANVIGPLGQAKTRVALALAKAFADALGIGFDMDRDLVVQDDLPHAYRLFPEFCDDCRVPSQNDAQVRILTAGKAELVKMCLREGLDPIGTKRDLITRLLDLEDVRETRDAEYVCPIHDLEIQIILWDEAHWFLYNEWHAHPEVKILTPIFMSNRKQRRIWIFSTDTIWKAVDFFRDWRVQIRIRMESRSGIGYDLATAQVFLRGGSAWNDRHRDAWGGLRFTTDYPGSDYGLMSRSRTCLANTIWTEIPRVADGLWDGYMVRYEDHVHTPQCVSRLRSRR